MEQLRRALMPDNRVEKWLAEAPRVILRDQELKEQLRALYLDVLTDPTIVVESSFLRQSSGLAMHKAAIDFIQRATARGKRAYVGMTGNPKKRMELHRHRPNTHMRLQSMHVIWVAYCSDEIAYWERQLIAAMRSQILNVGPGGEGCSNLPISWLYIGLADV